MDVSSKKSALKFVVLMGVVSLLADVTYEGARSITGPFMAFLGASAAAVGFVAGLGELIGYALRIVSGYITDKTRKYWLITIIGYAVNLIAVPVMALADRWEIAATLMVAERFGKAIRSPARDAMLSHATKRVGTGWGFGLHEAMDQIGALLGPIVVSLVMLLGGNLRTGFMVLAIPAALAITVVVAARFIYPDPSSFEVKKIELHSKGLPRKFWFYLLAVAAVAAGYADFPLIAYHLKKLELANDAVIPIMYSVAMGVDALSALVFGRLFDKRGFSILIISILVSILFAPLVFLGGLHAAFAGMALWGVGMGAQESIMRAAVADMVGVHRRGSAYGIFNTGYGLFWFLGSAIMGLLYDISVPYVVVFSMAMQLVAVLVLKISSPVRTEGF